MIDNTEHTFSALRLFPFDPRYTPAEIPSAGVFDSPRYMICVNAQWLSHVDGVIDRLAWRDAWKGTPEQQQWAVDEAVKLLGAIGSASICTTGEAMIQLRQNPENPCILQQSFDGGVTWETAFDYSLCRSGSGVNVDVGITVVDNDVTIYNENPEAFEPQLQDSDPNTDGAICYALEVLIRSALAGLLARLESQNNQNIIIQAVGSAIGIVATFTFGPVGAGIAVAIATSIGLIATSIMNQLSEQELEDILANDALIAELVCCAYDTLAGFRPTPAIFDDVLDTCPSLSTELTDVRPALAEVFDDFNTFVEFLRVAGQAYTYAEQGLLSGDCDACNTWCYEFDFEVTNGGFIRASGPNRGAYSAGVGWIAGNKDNGTACGVYILRTFTDAIITSVELEYNLTNQSTTRAVSLWLVNGATFNRVIFQQPAAAGTGVIKTWTGGYETDQIQIALDAATNQNCASNPASTIKRLKLTGTGQNPFGSSNC